MSRPSNDSELATGDASQIATPLGGTVMAGLIIFLILIWGSAYTMVGVAVREITPIWLVAYRLVIAAVFVTGYVYLKGLRLPSLRDHRWLWYFGLGMTGAVLPFFLLSKGQITVDSGLTSIIVGAMPLMTIILAHFYTHEKLTLSQLVGFFIGFLGIVILFLPDDFSLSLVADWKAQMLIVGAAFLYAVTTVAAKRAPKTSSSVGAAMMLICAAVVGVFAAVLTGGPAQMPSGLGLTMVVGLGIGSTALATIVYLFVIAETGPGLVARINYFVPVASVVFGVGLLNEPLTWRLFVSFGIILIGVIIARRSQT